jgi:hypothetical protein
MIRDVVNDPLPKSAEYGKGDPMLTRFLYRWSIRYIVVLAIRKLALAVAG